MSEKVISTINESEITPTGLSKSFIESYAYKVVQALNYKKGGDIVAIAKKLGGQVENVTLDEMDSKDEIEVLGPNDFIIHVERISGEVRKRFTIAHEIGHYLLHSRQGEKKIRVARQGSNRLEWEANWFAAAFLMPEDWVKQEYKLEKDVGVLSGIFNVSIDAMNIRLKALGLVSA